MCGQQKGQNRAKNHVTDFIFSFHEFHFKSAIPGLFRDRGKSLALEDLPLETAKHFVRYALSTKLSRCNDNALPSGLCHRLRNRVRLCQDWQLLCLSFYFRVPGYPTVTGIGYPVPKISVFARAYLKPFYTEKRQINNSGKVMQRHSPNHGTLTLN